jgi:RsiW-degrading membrane proteinase PrsW (M82 family)
MAILGNPYLLAALAAGILPTLAWLWFWLREDRFQPEPRGLLLLTYVAGGLMVFLVLPLESFIRSVGFVGPQLLLLFALIEELAKFAVVFVIDFHSSYLDEPIDYAIYLITGALGFATVENVMFLYNPEYQTTISFIIKTGTLRFLGATILHSMLAATLGIIIGFVFYKSKPVRRRFTILGLVIVTILHTLFNSFIIEYVQINGFLTLALLWVSTMVIIGLFERVRKINH